MRSVKSNVMSRIIRTLSVSVLFAAAVAPSATFAESLSCEDPRLKQLKKAEKNKMKKPPSLMEACGIGSLLNGGLGGLGISFDPTKTICGFVNDAADELRSEIDGGVRNVTDPVNNAINNAINSGNQNGVGIDFSREGKADINEAWDGFVKPNTQTGKSSSSKDDSPLMQDVLDNLIGQ